MMSVFKTINILKLVTSELSDQSMSVFINKLSATAVIASVITESQ